MRLIRPITVRFILSVVLALFLSNCSNNDKQAGGEKISGINHQISNTIADGKPVINLDSTNYSSVTFKHSNVYYEVNVSNDVPYFVTVQSDARADIEITESNEFLNYNDRAYAIIVDGGLTLQEIQ